MNKRKAFVLAIAAVIGVMAIAPAMANAAIGDLFTRKSGLSDLFTLDRLFAGAGNSKIISSGKVNLGNLFILDQLFPVTTAAATTPASLGQQLSGRILIQTEKNGEAWYVNPSDQKRYYLDGPATAFGQMSKFAVGISNADYNSYVQAGKAPTSLAGKFIIKSEDKGQLYYIYPVDRSINYVSGPSGAQSLIKKFGLGITNANIAKIAIGAGSIAEQ